MWDYKFFNVRSALILTNSYVAGTVLDADVQHNQLVIYADFTLGSLTDGRIKVEFSHDGTTCYQETFSSISTVTSTESLGEHKFTATGKYRIAIPLKDRWVKISALGTGTVTSSSMTVDAILGTV
jgi:hypothetical protein